MLFCFVFSKRSRRRKSGRKYTVREGNARESGKKDERKSERFQIDGGIVLEAETPVLGYVEVDPEVMKGEGIVTGMTAIADVIGYEKLYQQTVFWN